MDVVVPGAGYQRPVLIGRFLGALSILATWVVLALAFIGIGLAIVRRLGASRTDIEHWITAFWLGFIATIFFLHLWHFVLPISWHSLAIVLALGGLGCWWNRESIAQAVSGVRGQKRALFAIVLFSCALWVANGATASGDDWDYGVYHLPAIQWSNAYPVVPGLGNLHGRLAFNSSYHLYAAMLGTGPWAGKSNHLANGLLITALVFQILIAAFRLWRDPDGQDGRGGFALGFLAPAAFLVLRPGELASVRADLPVAVILFVASAKLFDLVAGPRRDAVDESHELIVLVGLLAVATCIKLTAVGFAIPAAIVGAVAWLRRNKIHRRLVARTFGSIASLIVLLGGSWMAHGVMLSGYAAYPSTWLAVPVEWRVPEQQANAEMAWIRHYGRWYYNPPMQSRGWIRRADGEWAYDPEPLDRDWRWLPGWISNLWKSPEHREEFVFPAVLAVAAGCLYLYARRRYAGRVERLANPGWQVLIPTLVGMASWFTSAPTPRFGYFLFWILAATVLTVTFRAYSGVLTRRLASVHLVTAFLIGSVPIVERMLRQERVDRVATASVLDRLLVRPRSDVWFAPSPKAQLNSFTTQNGLTLYVPARDQRCWDAPLPCTPQPAPNLALRQADRLQSGFVNTDGQWRQQDFPDPRTYRGREDSGR